MPLLFGDNVEYRFLGREYGDFHPAHEGAYELYQTVMVEMGLRSLFLPSLSFTNQVANYVASDTFELKPRLHRTHQKADGGIVIVDHSVGIAICNADCHVGIVFDPVTRSLCVMHMGLKCFYRAEGELPILVEALRVLKIEKEEIPRLGFWVGAGIGPCCNGYDVNDPQWGEHNQKQADELNERYGKNAVRGSVIHGPRKDQLSHNNLHMILNLASDLGLTIDRDCLEQCTSCAGMEDPDAEGFGTYWSNVRDLKKKAYRNMFVARIVP